MLVGGTKPSSLSSGIFSHTTTLFVLVVVVVVVVVDDNNNTHVGHPATKDAGSFSGGLLLGDCRGLVMSIVARWGPMGMVDRAFVTVVCTPTNHNNPTMTRENLGENADMLNEGKELQSSSLLVDFMEQHCTVNVVLYGCYYSTMTTD